jgi:hypothetical protein
MQATCSALEALFTATENFEPIFFETIFSNLKTFGPWVRKSDFKTLTTDLIS